MTKDTDRHPEEETRRARYVGRGVARSQLTLRVFTCPEALTSRTVGIPIEVQHIGMLNQ